MSRNHDPLDIDGQERNAESMSAKARIEEEIEKSDIKWLMSSKTGRRIVWRLLDASGVFRLSFNQNALTMAFNEGNRNYGNRMLSTIIALCPELYTVMMKEQKNGRDDDNSRKYN